MGTEMVLCCDDRPLLATDRTADFPPATGTRAIWAEVEPFISVTTILRNTPAGRRYERRRKTEAIPVAGVSMPSQCHDPRILADISPFYLALPPGEAPMRLS
jgi:hypothetical protein